MSTERAAPAAVASARRRAQADEWALVLASQGLHPEVERGDGGYRIAVPESERERARAALDAYTEENRPRHERAAPPPVDPAPLRKAGLAAAALLVFFLVTGPRVGGSSWFEQGSASAQRILAGEPWRAVTALTLHADGPHVAGNALIGALFWSAVVRSLGAGLAFAWILAAGTLGNVLNAWAQPPAHDSVGASTAVFGAVGLLGGLGVTRRLRIGLRGRRAWVPAAAALGLLGMLGTGGERVDLWAHAFGLAAGGGLGLAAGVALPRRPGPLWQWSAGLAAAAALVGAWRLALG